MCIVRNDRDGERAGGDTEGKRVRHVPTSPLTQAVAPLVPRFLSEPRNPKQYLCPEAESFPISSLCYAKENSLT